MTGHEKAGRGTHPGPARNNLCNQDYTAPIDRFISRLDCVRELGNGRWLARCPAHEDRTPSLSVRVTDDGRVLIKCFAGCGASGIVESIGLELADLFPDQPGNHRYDPVRSSPPVPRDVLKVLHRDLCVVALAARWILDSAGDQIIDFSEKDYSTLEGAVKRIHRVLDLSGAVGGRVDV